MFTLVVCSVGLHANIKIEGLSVGLCTAQLLFPLMTIGQNLTSVVILGNADADDNDTAT